MITTIDVVCDAESHPRWIVERFARMPIGDGCEWVPLPSSVSRLRRDKSSAMPVDEVTNAWGENVSAEAARARYGLRCRKCGDKVPVRHENLQLIFDRLAEHGVPSIRLTSLRARLSRSMDR